VRTEYERERFVWLWLPTRGPGETNLRDVNGCAGLGHANEQPRTGAKIGVSVAGAYGVEAQRPNE
jgi:hypothetical protein